jgi:hypothetical protein
VLEDVDAGHPPLFGDLRQVVINSPQDHGHLRRDATDPAAHHRP